MSNNDFRLVISNWYSAEKPNPTAMKSLIKLNAD